MKRKEIVVDRINSLVKGTLEYILTAELFCSHFKKHLIKIKILRVFLAAALKIKFSWIIL